MRRSIVVDNARGIVQFLCARLHQFLLRQDSHWRFKRDLRSGRLQIGKHTYGRPRIDYYRGSDRRVTIGSYTSISPGLLVITGGIHPLNWVSTYPFRINWRMAGALADGMPTSKGDVVIGSDVWIGTDVMILSGVNIGHGAIIAARSVVTHDVPPYTIAAGVPAKVIRRRFSNEIIEKMLTIKWWEWDEARIREAIPWLSSDRIDEFTAKYNPIL